MTAARRRRRLLLGSLLLLILAAALAFTFLMDPRLTAPETATPPTEAPLTTDDTPQTNGARLASASDLAVSLARRP